MAPKSKYSLNQFRKLVKEGKTRREIVEIMKISTPNAFNTLKLRLYEADGQVYKIKDGRVSKTKTIPTVVIGKKGILPISSKILEGSVFKSGDKFKVGFSKRRITLSLMD